MTGRELALMFAGIVAVAVAASALGWAMSHESAPTIAEGGAQ